MRKYQAIWEQIKREGEVRVKCHPSLCTRIVCAVRKEKNIDLPWKLLQHEEGNFHRLFNSYTDPILTFKLKRYESLANITIDLL